MREEGDRGRPAEEGGHKPLKISLNAETRAALTKVKKKQPVSKFIEEVIQPLARQFDPGPSSPLALEIMEKIRSERDSAFKREDMEEVVALDYFLLRVKPALDPFVAMSEPESGPESGPVMKSRVKPTPSLQVHTPTKGAFSEQYTKASLARLYYLLDYLTIQFESVFSLSKNIADLKVVRVVRGPKYIDLFTALKITGLISEEFDFSSCRQFVHDMAERKNLISRVLSTSHPTWSRELERPPESRTRGFSLPDYLLSVRIDHTHETYQAKVLAHMSPQFGELERNLSSAELLIGTLKQKYSELADNLRPLEQYRAFFLPGFRKCREYEKRDKVLIQSVKERLAKSHTHE